MELKERQFGEIITFYSFKGGTGRSMALANVAYLLAKKGTLNSKPQLIIDWDLEAPGLHRFFYRDFKNRFIAMCNNFHIRVIFFKTYIVFCSKLVC